MRSTLRTRLRFMSTISWRSPRRMPWRESCSSPAPFRRCSRPSRSTCGQCVPPVPELKLTLSEVQTLVRRRPSCQRQPVSSGASFHRRLFPAEPLSTGGSFQRSLFPAGASFHRRLFPAEPLCSRVVLCQALGHDGLMRHDCRHLRTHHSGAGARPEEGPVKAYLVDGTYELFRHYFGAPPHRTAAGEQVGATRAVLGSLLGMLEDGATHLGVATDHVIESWRNDAWPGYKSSAGVAEDLLEPVPSVRRGPDGHGLGRLAHDRPGGRRRIGVRQRPSWPTTSGLSQVLICTPDKDLGQCVQGRAGGLPGPAQRRHRGRGSGPGALWRRPGSVPDWLALVGDSADGYPGLSGWGAKRRAPCWAVTGRSRPSPTSAAAWDIVALSDGPHHVFGRHAGARPRPGASCSKSWPPAS